MNTLELLQQMRDKVEQGWTQGSNARTKAGFPVVPYADDACMWCLMGSMVATKESSAECKTRHNAILILGQLLANRNEPCDIPKFNDAEMRTQADVLELIDEAIDMVKLGGYD